MNTNTISELFELATRERFRYPYKGSINTEDLWDLDVEDLDKIFKALNSRLKAEQDESLLATVSINDTVLNAKIDIIKHIVSVKLAEAEARKKETENALKKQRILELIKEKQDDSLKNMSIEELQAMIAGL